VSGCEGHSLPQNEKPVESVGRRTRAPPAVLNMSREECCPSTEGTEVLRRSDLPRLRGDRFAPEKALGARDDSLFRIPEAPQAAAY
jgi:hypothetical protein